MKKLYIDTIKLKSILLENKNIDILLYLAKYNPNITEEDIAKKFGQDAIEGLKDLKVASLVKEDNKKLTLTEEGIFQVDGLLASVVWQKTIS